jgi:hypothetical protein
MITKAEFFKEFTKLHRIRIDAFFDKVMSKDDFISHLLCVFAEGLSVGDVLSSSGEACHKLNSFLKCDLYRAELIDVGYKDGDFFYHFEIQIANEDDGIELTFYLSHDSTECKVKDEDIMFKGDESDVWKRINQMLKRESSFGTLKRS